MNNFGCVLAVKCHCCYFVRLPTTVPCLLHCSVLLVIIVSAYRYIATTTLAIRAVFLEYLRQFLIDLHQTYRHSSVPKTRLRVFLEVFSSSGFRARRRRDLFLSVCAAHGVANPSTAPH